MVAVLRGGKLAKGRCGWEISGMFGGFGEIYLL
jgi:hypothetical protein